MINELKGINELITRIDAKVLEINTKLDELIKALHEYDDDLSYEPQHGACSKHDEASWDEIETNKRMDIIGQNGNEGIHYVTNEEADDDAEFSDYGMRIAKEVMSNKDNIRVGKDKSNNSDKHTGDKRKVVGKEMVLGEWQTKNKNKQYYKNNRSKRAENKK